MIWHFYSRQDRDPSNKYLSTKRMTPNKSRKQQDPGRPQFAGQWCVTCHFLAQVRQIKSEKNMCLNSTELHHVYTIFPKQNNEDDFSTSDGFQERPANVIRCSNWKVCESVCHSNRCIMCPVCVNGRTVGQLEWIHANTSRSLVSVVGRRKKFFVFFQHELVSQTLI